MGLCLAELRSCGVGGILVQVRDNGEITFPNDLGEMAWPIPLAPPVTTTTLPCDRI